MKNKISKPSRNKGLRKTNVECSVVFNCIKKIQIASFIYWCHKNKRLDLLSK
jgi:hypothetical protein